MQSKVLSNLTLLKKYGAIGVKTSFEDEGAHPMNVYKLRTLTHKVGLDLNLKIGGAEAKTDFNMGIDIGVDGIVAPMIESEFALSKFTSFSKNIDITRGINIESKQGVDNVDSMLHSEYINPIDYICIGRVDLASSYNKTRNFIESAEFRNIVTDTLIKIKDKNKKTCMGGSVDIQSYDFIRYLYKNNLIDKVETRYIIFNVNDDFLNNFDECIIQAHTFDYEYMNMLCSIGTMGTQEYSDRRDFIKNRIKLYV
jgi:4-hydroxy-2-oxoheptanedioate aldolase